MRARALAIYMGVFVAHGGGVDLERPWVQHQQPLFLFLSAAAAAVRQGLSLSRTPRLLREMRSREGKKKKKETVDRMKRKPRVLLLLLLLLERVPASASATCVIGLQHSSSYVTCCHPLAGRLFWGVGNVFTTRVSDKYVTSRVYTLLKRGCPKRDEHLSCVYTAPFN